MNTSKSNIQEIIGRLIKLELDNQHLSEKETSLERNLKCKDDVINQLSPKISKLEEKALETNEEIKRIEETNTIELSNLKDSIVTNENLDLAITENNKELQAFMRQYNEQIDLILNKLENNNNSMTDVEESKRMVNTNYKEAEIMITSLQNLEKDLERLTLEVSKKEKQINMQEQRSQTKYKSLSKDSDERQMQKNEEKLNTLQSQIDKIHRRDIEPVQQAKGDCKQGLEITKQADEFKKMMLNIEGVLHNASDDVNSRMIPCISNTKRMAILAINRLDAFWKHRNNNKFFKDSEQEGPRIKVENLRDEKKTSEGPSLHKKEEGQQALRSPDMVDQNAKDVQREYFRGSYRSLVFHRRREQYTILYAKKKGSKKKR